MTSGATRLEMTPLAGGTWQSGGDWGPVDEATTWMGRENKPAEGGLIWTKPRVTRHAAASSE